MKTLYKKSCITNGLESETVIFKKDDIVPSGFVKILKWQAYVSGFTLMLLSLILVAALVIVYYAPRPSNYLESCDKKSCNKDLNMKCINSICCCTNDQYFTNKCLNKQSYMGICDKDEHCKDYLECRDGMCQCGIDYYLSKDKCYKRKSYQETCAGDQCLTSIMLTCNSKITKCDCNSTR